MKIDLLLNKVRYWCLHFPSLFIPAAYFFDPIGQPDIEYVACRGLWQKRPRHVPVQHLIETGGDLCYLLRLRSVMLFSVTG